MTSKSKQCPVISCKKVLFENEQNFYCLKPQNPNDPLEAPRFSIRCRSCCDEKKIVCKPDDELSTKVCPTCHMEKKKTPTYFIMTKSGVWSERCQECCFNKRRLNPKSRNSWPRRKWKKNIGIV